MTLHNYLLQTLYITYFTCASPSYFPPLFSPILPPPRDTPDSPLLPQLLPSLSEDDLGVAKAALQLLAAAVHNRPRAALPLLASDPALLDGLYKHATKKPHLIKTVNLGPFKHQVGFGREGVLLFYFILGFVQAPGGGLEGGGGIIKY